MPFTFRRQPFKSLYFLCFAASLLFVRLPFWTLRYLLPSWRPVPQWPLSHMLIVKTMGAAIAAMFNTSLVSTNRTSDSSDERGFVWIDPKPELIIGEIKEAARINNIPSIKVPGYWYGKSGPYGELGQLAAPDEKVIYELHGGGYVLGSAAPKGGFKYLCEEMMKYTSNYRRAFMVEYRLSQGPPLEPSGAFPAALIDAVAGYHYLVNIVGFRPSNIMITGDSAGGNLALALARYIVYANLPSLPSPGSLFLHSPAVDWGRTHGGPNSSMTKFRNIDFVYPFFEGYPARSLLGNLPPSDASLNPWISPASLRLTHTEGLFRDLPPTLILAGGVEMSLDSMKTLAERMQDDLGQDLVKYIEIPNASHAVMHFGWHEPQRTQAYEEFARWTKNL